jgi:hypothetical protein
MPTPTTLWPTQPNTGVIRAEKKVQFRTTNLLTRNSPPRLVSL